MRTWSASAWLLLVLGCGGDGSPEYAPASGSGRPGGGHGTDAAAPRPEPDAGFAVGPVAGDASQGGSDVGIGDAGLQDSGSDARAPDPVMPGDLVAYLKAERTHPMARLGYAVAASGNTVVVASFSYDGTGAAFVFVRTAHGWAQQAVLRASNPDVGDAFGWQVAIAGDTVVVTAQHEASSARGVNGEQDDETNARGGAAYVFTRSAGVWQQEAYLKASGPPSEEFFGYGVAIDGDTIAVSAVSDNSASQSDPADQSAWHSGAVYVFVRSQGAWSQQAYLKASNPGESDRFGHSVALSGDTIAVGAIHEDSGSSGIDGDQLDESAPSAGAAYVFQRTDGAWTQQAYVKPRSIDAEDGFGYRVALSGDTLVVCAPNDDSPQASEPMSNDLTDSGAAYVFTRNGGTWQQDEKLKANNPDAEDAFCEAVALDGDALAVGAWFEASSATGIDGEGSDNGAPKSGAVYTFVRIDGAWTGPSYIKAPNAEADDAFGTGLALSGNLLVVGAGGEDSSATGVGGDQADESAEDSGAAYIFALP